MYPILRKENQSITRTGFGKLTFYAGDLVGNCREAAVGFCHILCGKANQTHRHTCTEILHVLEGEIIHTYNEKEYPLSAGDTIIIPAGVIHNARNIGEDTAILAITFPDSARPTEYLD